MGIRRGSTPTISVTAQGVDLTESTVYVTIEQSDIQVTKVVPSTDGSGWMEKKGNDTDVCVILSQAETLKLRPTKAQIQLRWIEADGTSHVSDIKTLTLTKTLLEGVIAYVR